MKKLIAMTLCLVLVLSMLAGCGGSKSKEPDNTNVPSYAELKVGEDYTDLTAELRVITHRTRATAFTLGAKRGVEDKRKSVRRKSSPKHFLFNAHTAEVGVFEQWQGCFSQDVQIQR